MKRHRPNSKKEASLVASRLETCCQPSPPPPPQSTTTTTTTSFSDASSHSSSSSSSSSPSPSAEYPKPFPRPPPSLLRGRLQQQQQRKKKKKSFWWQNPRHQQQPIQPLSSHLLTKKCPNKKRWRLLLWRLSVRGTRLEESVETSVTSSPTDPPSSHLLPPVQLNSLLPPVFLLASPAASLPTSRSTTIHCCRVLSLLLFSVLLVLGVDRGPTLLVRPHHRSHQLSLPVAA